MQTATLEIFSRLQQELGTYPTGWNASTPVLARTPSWYTITAKPYTNRRVNAMLRKREVEGGKDTLEPDLLTNVMTKTGLRTLLPTL